MYLINKTKRKTIIIMDIIRYMDDGATWEAQCVLAYLRANASNILSVTYNSKANLDRGTINVGRYEHGIEQGYVFSLIYKSEQRNEIVYAKKEAVPYIVERIKEKPSNLMWALNLIYGKKISDKKSLTITEACKLWVEEIEKQTKEQQDWEEH